LKELAVSTINTIVNKVKDINWIYVGKVSLVIIPAICWTPLYFIIKFVADMATRFDTFGADVIEDFFND
tara:strand:- start:726 stop:932 length:207 start_codon:yes stop_codon:yes gene_type:complete